MPDPNSEPTPSAPLPSAPYDPEAIFQQDGPLDPCVMLDTIQAMMRALPLDAPEPEAVRQRRMVAALAALAATNPRDPIEVMLAAQAVSAYHAACACWRIGMNLRHPRGDSTRHISAAATAARTFDTMLRAIERRQAKPLSVPVGRPAPRDWSGDGLRLTLEAIVDRIRRHDAAPSHGSAAELPSAGEPDVEWTDEDVARVEQMSEEARFEQENEGLDLANTEGILPGGGMIMPEDPTPNQAKYIARRLALMYRREHAENLRKGIKGYPRIRPLRTGDRVP